MEATNLYNLLLAALLGGLIGLNRELHNRPAGLRTHILLSIGACLFASISRQSADMQADPTRIAAQIVTGIGFLGAGTIIHQGIEVKGLTTAASIWVSAAVGMACGFGPRYQIIAIEGCLLAVATLTLVTFLERVVLKKNRAEVDIAVDTATTLSELNAALHLCGFRVIAWKQITNATEGRIKYQLTLEMPSSVLDPFPQLMEIKGILEVSLV